MSQIEAFTLEGEEDNKKIGILASVIIHLLLLLLLFPAFFITKIPPAGQKGIVIQFGIEDAGLEDAEDESQEEDQLITQETAEQAPEENNEALDATSKTPAPVEEESQEVITRDPNSEIVIDVAKDKKSTQPSQEEIEAQEKKAKADADAKRKADEEAQRQKDFDEKKKRFGDIISGGKNKGESTGDEGDPSGLPDKSVLDEIAKGSGKVGGGLAKRGVLYEPEIIENSQKSGTVVIEICVDEKGDVTTAKFTQRGSTTTDKSLVDVAIAGAKKYKFSASEIEKQCGTVTVNFIVK